MVLLKTYSEPADDEWYERIGDAHQTQESPASWVQRSMNSIGGVYLNAVSLALLDKALEQARSGRLTPTWRDELQPPATGMPAGAVFNDAGKLAVEEVRQMPYAAWEPGHSPGWREALEAWYIDSRSVLTQGYTNTTRQMAATISSLDKVVSQSVRRAGTGGSESVDMMLASMASSEDAADRLRVSHACLYIQARDRLTASYLAGLVAGGDDVDWIGWFKQRVARWPSEAAAGTRRAQIELGGPIFSQLMQRLPTYW